MSARGGGVAGEAADLRLVSGATEALLRQQGLEVRWREPDGAELPVSPPLAASPGGLLPALVVAGESVWLGSTGRRFSLDVARDPDALLGYRLRAIGAGGYLAVMLATMEATAQAARGGVLVANDLAPLWSANALRLPHGRTQPAGRGLAARPGGTP